MYGRSLEGTRAYASHPTHSEHISIIGAMGLEGIRAVMTVDGSTTGDVFYAFVEQLLVPTLNPGDVIIADNYSSHKVDGIRELIERTGATLIYLAPYCRISIPLRNVGQS